MKFEFKISLRDAQKAQEIMNDSPALRKGLNAIATDTYRTDSQPVADEFYHTLLGEGVEFTSNFDAESAGKGTKTSGKTPEQWAADFREVYADSHASLRNITKAEIAEQLVDIHEMDPTKANALAAEILPFLNGTHKRKLQLTPLAEQFEEVFFEMNDGNDPPLWRLKPEGVAEMLVDIEGMPKIKANLIARDLLPLIFLQRVERYMKNFPDNATTWRDAGDNMRDLARIVRQIGYNELTLDVLEDDPRANPGLDFSALKTPAEWNQKSKAFIRDLWPQLSLGGQKYVVEYVDQQLAANPQFAGKGAKTPYSKPAGSFDVTVITEDEISEVKALAKENGGVFIFKQRAGAYYSLSFNFADEERARAFKSAASRMRSVEDVIIESSAGHGAKTTRKKYSRDDIMRYNQFYIADLYKREFGKYILDDKEVSVDQARSALLKVPLSQETITISDTVTSQYLGLRGQTFPVKEIKTFFMASGPVEEYIVETENGEIHVPESMVVKTAGNGDRVEREAARKHALGEREKENKKRLGQIGTATRDIIGKDLPTPFTGRVVKVEGDALTLENEDGKSQTFFAKDITFAAGRGLSVNFDHGSERYYLRVGNIINEMLAGTPSYRYEIMGFRRDGDGQIAATVREKTTTKGRPSVEFTISLSDIREKMGHDYQIEGHPYEPEDPQLPGRTRSMALLAAECEIIEMQIVCEEVKAKFENESAAWQERYTSLESRVMSLELSNSMLVAENTRLEDEAAAVVTTAGELKADMEATLAAALPADEESSNRGVPVKTISFDEVRSWGGSQYDDATINAIVNAYPRGLAGILKDAKLRGAADGLYWEDPEEETDAMFAKAREMAAKVDESKITVDIDKPEHIFEIMYGLVRVIDDLGSAGVGTFIAGAATGAAAVALANTGLGKRTIAKAKSKLAGKGSATPPRRPGRAQWLVEDKDGKRHIVESVMRPRKHQTKTDVESGKAITIAKTIGRHKQ